MSNKSGKQVSHSSRAEVDRLEARRSNRLVGALQGWRHLLFLLGAWLIPVVVLLVGLPLSDLLERQAVTPEAPTTVEVGIRQDDLRTAVVVSVALKEAPITRFSASGVVTSVGVSMDSELAQGSVIASINYVPVLAFIGSSPLVRDLQQGDRGPDVAALATYLRDLGHLNESAVSDRFGGAMRNAVVAFQRAIGTPADGLFRLSYVSFVPNDFGLVAEVPYGVGDSVVAGDVAAAGVPQPVSVKIKPATEGRSLNMFAGREAVLFAGAEAFPVGDFLAGVDDVDSLVSWLDDYFPAVRAELGDEDSVDYDGLVLALAEPNTYGTVPSTAVIVSEIGGYCVIRVSDGASIVVPVEPPALVGAELGVVGIDPVLSGMLVVRDVSAASSDLVSQCG